MSAMSPSAKVTVTCLHQMIIDRSNNFKKLPNSTDRRYSTYNFTDPDPSKKIGSGSQFFEIQKSCRRCISMSTYLSQLITMVNQSYTSRRINRAYRDIGRRGLLKVNAAQSRVFVQPQFQMLFEKLVLDHTV